MLRTFKWSGPEPEGSYFDIGFGVRMATPEFYFMRMANKMPFRQAVEVGMELCGKYRTKLTCPSVEQGYDFLRQPRTNTKKIMAYLCGMAGTPEFHKAMAVLDYVEDNSTSPMDTFLFMTFSLPREYGGVGIERPDVSAVYDMDGKLMPSSTGEFLAYDICWPGHGVAVQYIGNEFVGIDSIQALISDKIEHVFLLTDDGLDDFADFVASVALAVCGSDVRPEIELEAPTFHDMRLTFENTKTGVVEELMLYAYTSGDDNDDDDDDDDEDKSKKKSSSSSKK